MKRVRARMPPGFYEAQLRKVQEGNRGRPRPPEVRRKISESLRGHPPNPGSGRGKSGWREDLDGYFRSRWEANVARTFRAEGVAYVYEPCAFPLDGDTYRPDFYLPDLDCFVEVTGYLTPGKALKVAALESRGFMLLHITPDVYADLEREYGHLPEWEEYARRPRESGSTASPT